MLDTGHFVSRAKSLYGYDNFICDTSGSICEVVDIDDAKDPVMSSLSSVLLPVWIEGGEAHQQTLIARFDRAPTSAAPCITGHLPTLFPSIFSLRLV